MTLDTDRIDEAALGLLYLTLHDGGRAWKGLDWAVLARLHEKGLIECPVNKAKSLVFTEEGLALAAQVVATKFSRPAPMPPKVRYGKAAADVTPAGGVTGFLHRSVDGEPFFRVHEADGGFSDYALRHDDLKVTIAPDALAAFYRIGDRHLLDHSPDVLGKVESDTSWPSGT